MKGSVIWSNLISLAALTGVLYWRDLAALAQTMSSLGQAGFTVVIAFFILFSTYQKREALKTLTSLSESKAASGAFLLAIALCLYVLGSYTDRVLWLHYASLLTFIAGYLVLRVDRRIPRLVLSTLVVSLFLLPLPVEVKILDNLNISGLFAFLVITLFLTQSFDVLDRWKAVAASVGIIPFIALGSTGADLAPTFSPMIGASLIVLSCVGLPKIVGGKTMKVIEPCPLCQLGKIEEMFCPHCGRRLALAEPTPEKHSFLRQVVLWMAIIILGFSAIPVLCLEDGDITIRSFGAWGTEEQSALPTPQGWLLYSSQRLPALEREYGEEMVLKNVYVGVERPEKDAYTLYLEMGARGPYLAGRSLQTPGWKKIEPPNNTIPFGEAPPGRYVVLQKEDKAVIVLVWTVHSLVMSGSTYLVREVGASIAMNLTGNPDQTAISEAAERMGGMFEPTATLWDLADYWTGYALTAKEICDRLAPLTISVAGLGGLVALVLKAKQYDGNTQKRVDSVLFLPEEDKLLLSTILTAREQRIALNGGNIFDLYRVKIESAMGEDRFYEKMKRLLNKGMIRKELSLRGSEVSMEWRLNI